MLNQLAAKYPPNISTVFEDYSGFVSECVPALTDIYGVENHAAIIFLCGGEFWLSRPALTMEWCQEVPSSNACLWTEEHLDQN